MADASIRDELRSLHFLNGLPDEDLERVAAAADRVQHPANAIIFREGQSSPYVYVVAVGSVALEICAPGQGCRRIHTVGPGELLGWSPLLGREPMTATARSITPVALIRLDAAQLVSSFDEHPRFGYELMKKAALALAARLNATRLHLMDVYRAELPPVDEKESIVE